MELKVEELGASADVPPFSATGGSVDVEFVAIVSSFSLESKQCSAVVIYGDVFFNPLVSRFSASSSTSNTSFFNCGFNSSVLTVAVALFKGGSSLFKGCMKDGL